MMLKDVFRILETLRESVQDSTSTKRSENSIMIKMHTWKSGLGNLVKFRSNPSNADHSKVDRLKSRYSWSKDLLFLILPSNSKKTFYITFTSLIVVFLDNARAVA